MPYVTKRKRANKYTSRYGRYLNTGYQSLRSGVGLYKRVRSGYKMGKQLLSSYRNLKSNKTRYRGGASRTKRVRKDGPQKVETSGHSTFIKNYLGITLSKNYPKGRPPIWDYRQTHYSVLNGTPGKQTVNIPLTLMTQEQITTSSGTGYNIVQNAIALRYMNPNSKNTGSAHWAALSDISNDKFWVKDIEIKTDLMNATGYAGTVDFIWYQARANQGAGPDAQWIGEVADNNFGEATQTFAGAGAAGGQVDGKLSTDMMFMSPLEGTVAKGMKPWWKFLAKKSVDLSGSETQRITTHIKVNKVIDVSDALDNAGNVYIKNTSIALMVILRGACLLDDTEGADRPTYAGMKVAFINHVKYTMCAVKANNRLAAGPYGISNIPTNTSQADELFVNTQDILDNISASIA